MEFVVFIAVVALWVVFLAAMVFSQSSMSEVWTWFTEQPLALQIPLGFAFLPWVAGMWVWESSWAMVLRVVMVTGLAWATVFAFFPWKAQ